MNLISKDNIIMVLIPFLTAFFTPIAPMIILVVFLLFADLFTGIWKSTKKGRPITSEGMSYTITKLIMYFLAIAIGRAFEMVFLDDLNFSIPLASFTAGYISLVEVKSNFENIGEITGTDIWSLLKDKLNGLKSGAKL